MVFETARPFITGLSSHEGSFSLFIRLGVLICRHGKIKLWHLACGKSTYGQITSDFSENPCPKAPGIKKTT